MKDLVHKSMSNLTPEIATEIKGTYEGGVKDFNVNMKPVLTTGFGLPAVLGGSFWSSSSFLQFLWFLGRSWRSLLSSWHCLQVRGVLVLASLHFVTVGFGFLASPGGTFWLPGRT